MDRCPSQGECTHETSLPPVFQPRPCPTPLYISAWLVELRLGVRNPWDARRTDANQLGLGPNPLYGVVMVPDVPREGKRLCPHVSPNCHIASAVPSDEAQTLRSDKSSLPLLRGAIGSKRDALPGNAYPWERGRLPSATLPGCHLTPRCPRPAPIATPTGSASQEGSCKMSETPLPDLLACLDA